MKAKKITSLGLFTAIALTIYVIESAIPPLVPIPGIKLGLANIISLYVMHQYGYMDALAVTLARIVLSGIYSGGMVFFLYSLVGGLFCYAVMVLVSKMLHGRFIPITSIMGAIAHNTGQICVAFLVLKTAGIFVYIPFLMISGGITGLFTGLSCMFAYRRLKNIVR